MTISWLCSFAASWLDNMGPEAGWRLRSRLKGDGLTSPFCLPKTGQTSIADTRLYWMVLRNEALAEVSLRRPMPPTVVKTACLLDSTPKSHNKNLCLLQVLFRNGF